jgi:hypothetical protein
MKALACFVLTLGALTGPVLSFAQSSEPVTREQVNEELNRLAAAGYKVNGSDHTTYPTQIQAAEAKVAAQDGQQDAQQNSQQTVDNAVGGTTMTGTSAAGSPADLPKPPSSCNGPASYCSIFFGN